MYNTVILILIKQKSHFDNFIIHLKKKKKKKKKEKQIKSL